MGDPGNVENVHMWILIHLFNQYLLSASYVPHTVLGWEDIQASSVINRQSVWTLLLKVQQRRTGTSELSVSLEHIGDKADKNSCPHGTYTLVWGEGQYTNKCECHGACERC